MAKPVSQEFLARLDDTFAHAVAMQREGHLAEAEKIYARIVKVLPDHIDALQLLAEIKLRGGKAGEALRLMNAAVAARPDLADVHLHHGLVLRALRRDADAIASFDRALALQPDHLEALGSRGDALLSLNRTEEAVDCFNRILVAAPAHPAALANRGAALAMHGRHAEALADFDAALLGASNDAMALVNRAHALHNLGRDEDALAAYGRAIAAAPQNPVAWNGHGNALTVLNRQDEAVASFRSAIAMQPGFADAHFNLALALLATGDYAQGFAEYEWRWKRTGMAAARHAYGKPLWLGEFPLERRTILLHAEQGLGDTVQFARYAPLLARAGARVVLEVQAEVKPALAGLAGIAAVLARGEPSPPFDVHCPLGSLPLALKTELANVPADIPYLAADPARIARWQPRLAERSAPRIAVAWAGNPAHPNDRNRSIPAATIARLWVRTGMGVVSLQRDLRTGDADVLAQSPAVLALGPDLADLADTAAVLAQCDLVVAVDTAVAHLAAAMGRPTWILLPFSPDWRWTRERSASPWYPAARLFRQPKLGDWDSVIEKVAAELATLFEARAGAP